MGWSSYLEDITDRLTDGLDRLGRLKADAPNHSVAETRLYMDAWIAQARGLLNEVQSCLNYATEPALDMAYQVRVLEKEKRDLEQELRKSQAHVRKISESKLQLRQQLEDLQHKYDEIEARIEAGLANRDQAEDIYAAYSRPQEIHKYKPNS